MKFSINKIKHHQLSSSKTGEEFSLSAVLSELCKFEEIFVHHEILMPGRRSSSPHAHTKREELVYVLSGEPTAHLRGEICELAPGDFVGFPAGEKNLHWVENETATVVRLLVIASNPKEDEVVYA